MKNFRLLFLLILCFSAIPGSTQTTNTDSLSKTTPDSADSTSLNSIQQEETHSLFCRFNKAFQTKTTHRSTSTSYKRNSCRCRRRYLILLLCQAWWINSTATCWTCFTRYYRSGASSWFYLHRKQWYCNRFNVWWQGYRFFYRYGWTLGKLHQRTTGKEQTHCYYWKTENNERRTRFSTTM